MEKITEQSEQVTVYRNAKGEVIGLLVEEQYNGAPLFTSYHQITGGYNWLSQGDDRDKVLNETRASFFYHSHFCPTCRFNVDCDKHYHCDSPDRELICEECATAAQAEVNQ